MMSGFVQDEEVARKSSSWSASPRVRFIFGLQVTFRTTKRVILYCVGFELFKKMWLVALEIWLSIYPTKMFCTSASAVFRV